MSPWNMLRDLSFERLFGFSYAGGLAALIFAVVAPAETRTTVEALGAAVALLAIVAVGGSIFVAHRYVVGELFLYPVLHLVHMVWDYLRGRHGSDVTDTVGFLRALGVKRGELRSAYNSVRRSFFGPAESRSLDLSHGELHFLWITVTEFLAVNVCLQVQGRPPPIPTVMLLLLAVAAAVADIRQHQVEAHMMKIAERDRGVSSFLKSAGFLQ